MKTTLISFFITLLAASGIATNAAADTSATTNAANDDDDDVANVFPKTAPRPRRVLITKYEDIADRIRNTMRSQAARQFDIEAEVDDDFATGYSTLLLHLDKITPAVTPKTVFKFHPSRQFNQEFVNDLAILASSPGKGREFAMMSVDTQTGNVIGLQRGRNGETKQLFIGSEGSVQGPILHARTMSRSAPTFTCGVDHTDHHHDYHDHESKTPFHQDHERKIPLFIDYHKPESTKLVSPEDVHSQSTDKELFRTTATDGTSGNAYHGFIINLVIAVDADLITRQGGTREVVEYVNFLVSAANVIYEEEVNARLNVVRIEETEIFENVNSLRDGLKTMRLHYEGTFGGDDANLIHAMLGKAIGGGIAFIDTVCDSKWGVGLSSGLRGTMNSLDNDALHDAFMVAHEIGHSLGSGHTFDDYDPPVDVCDGNACPADSPNANSATLMSYCNFCDGGLNNIALTLGGVWNGVGSKFDVDAWDTTPYIEGSVSVEPRRVSHRIWTRLTSKGECIGLITTQTPTVTPTDFHTTLTPTVTPTAFPTTRTPTVTPTAFPTTRTPTVNPTISPTQTPTLSPTTVPTSIAPTFYPTAVPTTITPTFNPTKSPTFFPELPDDGRYWFQPERHCMQEMNCAATAGIMFDLSLLEEPFSYGLLVESMQFEHKHLNVTLDLHTTEGSYVGREQLSDQWSKVATVGVNETHSYTEIIFDTPIAIPPGHKQGFYLFTPNADNFFLVGIGSWSSSSTDANGVSLQGGSVTFDMFGINVTGYYPTVQAGYTMALPPTTHPTSLPTLSPTTQPTFEPTTSSPTLSPTTPPSMQPMTSSPTLSAPPTVQPSTSSPTLSPTTPPTLQPTTSSPTLSAPPTVQPTTSSPTLSPTMDHGPFSIRPDFLCDNDCFAAPGFMFSVKNRNNANREIIITGVSFEHIAPIEYQIVDLYLTGGSYSGREQDPGQWQKIASLKVPHQEFHFKEFVFDTPITLAKGGIVGFYLKTEEHILLVGKHERKHDEQSDSKVQLVYGSVIMSGSFGAALEGYSWNGAVTYSTNTFEPTFHPTTLSPTISSPTQ